MPRDTYQAGLSEPEQLATPAGSLKGLAFSCIVLIFLLFVFATSLASDATIGRKALNALMALAVLYVAVESVASFARGLSRHRNGMTAFGRDDLGMTHGDTVFRILPEGIDLRRTHLRKMIRWEAIGWVEPKDGWLSLRTADMTLDVLPSSPELVRALSDAGFKVPTNPWEVSKASQTWQRAA